MTVLVVEDDEIIAEGLIISLEQEGCHVLHASTQAKALELLNSNETIEISLLDVNLPDGDGYTVCKEIRMKSQMPIRFIQCLL